MALRRSPVEGMGPVSADLFGGVFAGRRVFVTGHTGFKGSWLTRWLLDLGARVTGYALEPDTDPSLFEELGLARHMDSRIGDVRDFGSLSGALLEARPEIVLHLAAQPLVRRSYAEPLYTFETNVIGTANLLEAVRGCEETRVVVNVTTDKVYENPETGHPFAEDEPLGGHDPYSASKACSEIVSAAYRSSFFAGDTGGPALATARAGNVIGGGDWSEDRIVPDIVRAMAAGVPVQVRNPDAVRPWQHVLEPLAGYLTLAEALWRDGQERAGAYNFGPEPDDVHPVRDLVDRSIEAWGAGSWEVQGSADQPHEAGLLSLSIDKACDELGWRPLWGFGTTVERTVSWYRRVATGEDPETVTREDLSAYSEELSAGS